MNVITDGRQISVSAAINHHGLETSGEQMAAGLVAKIKPHGINAQQPFHAGNEVGGGGLDDQMKMIGHQAICVNLPAGFLAGIAENAQKTAPV